MEMLPLGNKSNRHEASAFCDGSLYLADTVTEPRVSENGYHTAGFDASSDTVALVNPSADAAGQYLHGWKLAIIIISLCAGTFLVALDVAIIGVAIPRITTDFHSLDDISWYASAYLLGVTALQPTFGALYKLFNVKIVYLVSIALFELGSVICAVARNSPTLIVGRAVAGVGAAGLFQGALCIVAYTVVMEKRPLHLGFLVGMFGISVCIGPVLGGTFTDHVSWRWCFWINVPIGSFTLLSILVFLKLKISNEGLRRLPFREKLQYMDGLGTVTFVGAICCSLLALQWGGHTKPWSSPEIIGLFVASGLLLLIFCYVQWKRGETAIIPLRVLRQRSILMGAFFLFFLGMASVVYAYYMPIYFQSIQSVSATESGIKFIALIVPQIVATALVGALITQYGYYVPFMIIGTAISIVGYGLLTTIGLDTPTVLWAAYLAICGLGMGSGMNVPYTALQAVLSEEDIPTGNAISVFAWQLGGALAASISQSIFINKLFKDVSERLPALDPSAVISAGAANLQQLSTSTEMFQVLRELYASAVHDVFVYALVAACMALTFTFGMEWLNLKVVAKRKGVSNSPEKDTDAEQV